MGFGQFFPQRNANGSAKRVNGRFFVRYMNIRRFPFVPGPPGRFRNNLRRIITQMGTLLTGYAGVLMETS